MEAPQAERTTTGRVIEAHMEGLRPARLRELPSVNAVLNSAAASQLLERFGHVTSTNAIRVALEEARAALQSGVASVPTEEELALRALISLDDEDRSGLRPATHLHSVHIQS